MNVETLVSLNPHYIKASQLFNEQRYIAAIEEFNKALKAVGNNAAISRYKIYCLHQLHLMPQATEEAINALRNGVEDYWSKEGL